MEIFRCCRSCGQVSLGVKGGGINPISFPALYPPDPTDKHLSFPGWEEGSPGKSGEIVTRGYEEGKGGGFYGLPLFLHCTYAITKEEMPTSAVSVNEIIKISCHYRVYNFPAPELPRQPATTGSHGTLMYKYQAERTIIFPLQKAIMSMSTDNYINCEQVKIKELC